MVQNYITNFQLYIGMMIAGIFTGLGSALGSYLANRGIITQFKKLIKKKNGNIKSSRRKNRKSN